MIFILKHCFTIMISTVLLLSVIPSNVSASAKTVKEEQMEGVIRLNAKETYQYDLNQDGTTEDIKYEYTENEVDYKTTVKLYINSKLSMEKVSDGWAYDLQICDLDTSDRYLDLYLYSRGASDVVNSAYFIRYNGENLSEITSMEENRPKGFEYFRYGLDKINGDGTFTVWVDTPIFSEAIGCYICSVSYQLKDNQISLLPTKTYALNETSKEYKYKAQKNFTVYKKAGSKSVSFKVKKGSKVTFEAFYVSKSGKAYMKVKNSQGKTGWINAALKDLFYERPLWG